MARPTGHFGGDRRQEGEEGFIEKVVRINRTAKVVKGGRRFGFAVLAVAGDGKGQVGIALGKAKLVPDAVRKAIDRAKRSMIAVPIVKGTIPFQVLGRYGTARVILKPASPGTGVIAGGAVRAVIEASGIKDVLSKSLGSSNAVNVLKATMNGLGQLRRAGAVAEIRGLSLEQLYDGVQQVG
ncbi:MAG: 30S ribosomal protein S5 [Candidatus Riflebacteria bacterium]|nr:30S ribosomal protein S5 [Candidatus Riflebacteria bacterium]